MARPFYEEGTYIVEVTNQALGEASTGTPQFVLEFKVLGQPDPDDAENYFPAKAEYTRRMYRAITERTVEYLMKDLEKLGFQGSSFGQLDPEHPQAQSFIGKQYEFYCKHKPDFRNPQDLKEEWGFSYTPGASTFEVKRPENKAVRQLDSLFGAYLPGSKAFAPGPNGSISPQHTISGSPAQVASKIAGAPVIPQVRSVGKAPAASPQPVDQFAGMGITDDDVPFS